MKTLNTLMVSAAILVGASGAQAAEFVNGKPLLCAVQSVSECSAGAPCENLMPFQVNMPDFFLIDPANNKVTASLPGGVQRETPIEYSERLDGRLILQGADDGIEGVRDGIAWSVAIDEEVGTMIISASGHGFALAAFGVCTFR